MDSETDLNSPSIAGLNLKNYFPTKNTYDSVIYVHKKYLPQYKDKFRKNHEVSDVKRTYDKCQQFDSENTEIYKVRKIDRTNVHKDPVVEQTIKFAKTIVPLTIPPSIDGSPHPEYIIKAIKKSKKKSTNISNHKSESANNATYEKEKPRSIFEHFKRDRLKRQRDSISVRETVSSSQNNTLDDVNENQTLSCTLSEISDKKHYKEDGHSKRNKRNETQKVAVSESFEAVATEFMNTSSDTKIKIHLMNERDKNLFCENIQRPVIETLKESIMELNNKNLKALQGMQSSIDYQTKKMDLILSKLASFESKLDFYIKEKASETTTFLTKVTKASKLEELGTDIMEVKETSDEEELGQIDLLNKSKDGSVSAIKYNDNNVLEKGNKKIENLGCGENVPGPIKARLGLKVDRPNRVPARFCWTDTASNN